MKKKPLLWGAAAALVLIVLAAGVKYVAPFLTTGTESETPAEAPVFEHDTLNIKRGADGATFRFAVELATTPKQAAYGLMFRKSIEPGAGMLFIWDIDHPVSMWMKNTYVPLDMLFIRADGSIAKIITHAVPLNLTPLSSDEPVHAVMEIKAGEADRLNLKTGDKVLFWAFKSAL